MATKTLKVIRPGRYGTRMLQAGDTFDATAPEARLYSKLGWATESKAKAKIIPAADQYADGTIVPAKAAPRKPRAKKKAPAKKKA